MKVAVLARPDHSVALYQELCRLGIDTAYHTFHAFREGSVLHRALPTRKTVPHTAHTALAFTLLAYPTAIVGRRLGVNWRTAERWLGRWLLRAELGSADVVHYWPFFFDHVVERARRRRPGLVTLADFYEAEPSFVNAIYADAYRQIGASFDAPFNELIDQNAAFEREPNFVVASEFSRRSYLRRFPAANIHVVSYGLLGRTIARRRRSGPNRRWVFVGAVSVEKGVHVLLDAIEQCPELSLDLIGPIKAGQEPYFERRLRGMPRVRALGRLPNVEVIARLPSYDAFVLPSLSDAYSIAVIEAICAGLPVVVSDHCGNAPDVACYGLGEVCAVNDAGGLAVCMARVADHFSEAQHTAAQQRFEADEAQRPYGVRMIELYRELLAGVGR